MRIIKTLAIIDLTVDADCALQKFEINDENPAAIAKNEYYVLNCY